jgi:hypothetical protein
MRVQVTGAHRARTAASHVVVSEADGIARTYVTPASWDRIAPEFESQQGSSYELLQPRYFHQAANDDRMVTATGSTFWTDW